MNRIRPVAAAALVVAFLTPVLAQDALSKRVSLDLKAVDPSTAFTTIASAVGLAVTVDPAVTAPVDIVVQNVKASTALDTICDSIGCHWTLAKGTIAIQPGVASRSTATAFTVRGGTTTDRQRAERVQAALTTTLPAGFAFDKAPLSEVSARLGEALGLRITIECDNPEVKTFTADLSGQTLQSALKAFMDQMKGTGVWTIRLSRVGDDLEFGLKMVSRPKK